jgi:hypothetical protein
MRLRPALFGFSLAWIARAAFAASTSPWSAQAAHRRGDGELLSEVLGFRTRYPRCMSDLPLVCDLSATELTGRRRCYKAGADASSNSASVISWPRTSMVRNTRLIERV